MTENGENTMSDQILAHVFPPGTPVKIGGDIEAWIRKVCIEVAPPGIGIHFPFVTYKVIWWDGRQQQSAWMPREELSVCTEQKLKPVAIL